ncbi:hypothetical protein G6L37_02190 [Agrobacterium rubi]|nr:hypothetical protein [Agrobacterium rubi]NTF24204.1 hypothetical protein [Agrobacterium rubi]
MTKQRRAMKMHPALLFSVIERQAGTIGKAILEGGMNSVDAGATYCDINITEKSFSIVDDGKGFRDEQEIENFFETFGFPHKEGDATYGQFRMGRGQMFAFGKNVWRTGQFKMTVDMKPEKDAAGEDYALGYDFEKLKENVKGCGIDVKLYNKLVPSELDRTIREVKKYLRFVNIPVKLNGELISVDPTTQKWDEITDDAYILRKQSGNLEVYNLGVLVKDSPSYYSGVAGLVVSKKQLKVNFARNDIQSDCPIWRRVNKLLQNSSMEKAKKAERLSDHERGFLVQQLVSSEAKFETLKGSRLITDVTNSHHPLKKLESVTNFSIAKVGDRVAEMAHTRKLAFVMSQECAERFGVSTPEEFAELVHKMRVKDRGWNLVHITPVPRSDFDRVISSHHEPLKDSELEKAEMIALRAIREGAKALFQEGSSSDIWGEKVGETFSNRATRQSHRMRRISAGASDTANGWTNGTTDIWINRKILKKMKDGLAGYMQVSALLLHEYIHRDASTGTHDHGIDFYEQFHEYSMRTKVLQKSSSAMLKSMTSQLRAEGKGLSSILSALEDDVFNAEELGLGAFSEETTAVPESELDAEFTAAEQEAVAATSASSLAADIDTTVQRRTRRAKADENQFILRF